METASTGETAPGISLPAEGADTCPNCGREAVGRYCSHCGQRLHGGRFSLRTLLADAAIQQLNLDRGFLHTVLALAQRPGPAVREYIGGRTQPYTNPLRFLLVTAAVVTFAGLTTGVMDPNAFGVTEDFDAEQQRILAVFTRYFNLFLMGVVPFLSGFSRLFFRRRGFNLTENLIFNVYVFSLQNLVFLLLLPIALLPSVSVYLFFNLYTIVTTVYYCWAAKGFFGVTTAAAAFRGTGVQVAAYLAYLAVAGVAGLAYAVLSTR